MRFISNNSTVLKVTKQQYEAVSNNFLPKLINGLPAHLTYHNADHITGVIRDTRYLMQREGVPEDEWWLVLTAALFHDSGFMRGYKAHEDISCDIAKEVLPGFGFKPEVIESICQMIMATKLPQTPLDYYAEILCDADLFYLGTDTFFPTGATLFREMMAVGTLKSKEDWERIQLNFLHQHHYFTQTAMAELEPKKQEHILLLESQQVGGE